MRQEDHQLGLSLGGAAQSGMVKTTRARNKRRATEVSPSPPPLPPPELAFPEGVHQSKPSVRTKPKKFFLPMAGVPATRGQCPDTSRHLCGYVHCRFNLLRIDAEDRAGRPGLSDVPRDAHGRTLTIMGDVGKKRAGTTLRPAWMRLERTCLMRVHRDERGCVVEVEPLHRTYETNAMWNFESSPIGTWDLMRPTLRAGQVLHAFSHVSGDFVALARFDGRVVRFDADFSDVVVMLANVDWSPPSCALDEASKGPRTNTQIGDAEGKHRTLEARKVKSALASYIEKGGTLEGLRAVREVGQRGVSLDENR